MASMDFVNNLVLFKQSYNAIYFVHLWNSKDFQLQKVFSKFCVWVFWNWPLCD